MGVTHMATVEHFHLLAYRQVDGTTQVQPERGIVVGPDSWLHGGSYYIRVDQLGPAMMAGVLSGSDIYGAVVRVLEPRGRGEWREVCYVALMSRAAVRLGLPDLEGAAPAAPTATVGADDADLPF